MLRFVGIVLLLVTLVANGLIGYELMFVYKQRSVKAGRVHTTAEFKALVKLFLLALFVLTLSLAFLNADPVAFVIPMATMLFACYAWSTKAELIKSAKAVWTRAQGMRQLFKADVNVDKEIQITKFSPAPLSEKVEGVLTEEIANNFVESDVPIDLKRFTYVLPQAARVLSSVKCKDLLLSGLEQLSLETAVELVGKNTGTLNLDGLRQLPSEIAEILSQIRALKLSLNGLTEISIRTAEALQSFQGQELSLHSLQKCNSEICKCLSEANARLVLSPSFQFEQTTGHVALAIKQGEKQFGFIKRLNVNQAELLKGISAERIILDNLHSIDALTAQRLVEFPGDLFLNGLQEIDESGFALLMQCRSVLSLPRIRQISDAMAMAFSSFQGTRLLLRGVSDLTPAHAANLANLMADVELAEDFHWRESVGHMALASKLGVTQIGTVKRLGEFECQALKNHPGKVLLLDQVELMSTAALRSLAEFKGSTISLCGLNALPEYGGEALSEFRGKELALNGIQSLDLENAKGLALFSGNQVWLLGLREVSDEAAEVLASASFDTFIPRHSMSAESRVLLMDAKQQRQLGSFLYSESE